MHRHIPLAGLCLAVFLIMTGMGVAAVALPGKYLQLSGTMRSSGWIASCFAVSYVLCQVPVGRWADRHGYWQVLALGCFLIAVSALIFSTAKTPAAIYAGRFIQGAGEAPVWASAPALLGRLYPTMRGRVMGLYNAAFHLGLMLGPLLGACFLVRTGMDPFLVFAGASLVALVLVVSSLRGRQPSCGDAAPAREREAGAARYVWPVICAIPFYGAVYGLLVSCLPVHLTVDVDYSPERLGAFLFVVYAGIAVAQLTGGVLSDRYGRVRFIVGGLVGISVGLSGFIVELPLGFMGAGAVMGLGLGFFAVASMALMNERAGRNCEGRASGLYFAAWGCGYFSGPLLVNLVGLASGVWLLVLYAFGASLVIAWRFSRGVR
ncbi:MAG: MFS transporter [Proteobacteria bacterium]|nr:MFS transporter [Pseudomonadota bacterium]